jgi:outer membrane protein assembly factor BamB
MPIARGWSFFCLNDTTGQEIWNITGSMTPGAMADGYTTASNTYDGREYVFGMGLSATTVTAPTTAQPLGTPVLIQGTVLDQSPAQPGTPCVSDNSMGNQMEYLHMQAPIDGLYHNVAMTGVPVVLTAIGSDGTVYNIGTVTTNAYYGTFSMAWTPSKVDTYTITASYAGSDSYGSSSAGTSLLVNAAPTATPTSTPIQAQAAPDYTMAIIASAIAVIIAVAIATVIIVLLFRKRP